MGSLTITINLLLALPDPASQFHTGSTQAERLLQPIHSLLPKILHICPSLAVLHDLLYSTTSLLSILISRSDEGHSWDLGVSEGDREFKSTPRSKCVHEPESTHVPNGCAL